MNCFEIQQSQAKTSLNKTTIHMCTILNPIQNFYQDNFHNLSLIISKKRHHKLPTSGKVHIFINSSI